VEFDHDPRAESEQSILAWLRDQGYWLEHYTESVLRANRFSAALGLTYRDADTGKLRDIDVLAQLHLGQPQRFHPYAVFECKSGKSGAWVVRQTDVHQSDLAIRPIASERLAAFLAAKPNVLRLSFPISRPVGFAVLQVGKSDNRRGDRAMDPAFDACRQVVSAARGALSLTSGSTFVHPVVVIAAPLYGLTHDANGDERLEARPWARVVFEGERIVDVVKHDQLRDYLQTLRSEFEELAWVLGQNDWTPDQ
jgi:hypothetical protein